MADDGWTFIRLGDVCTKIGSGATPHGGSNVYLDAGRISLIRSQNVYNEGFRHEGLVYISQEHANQLSNVEVQPGDVLLNITGDSVARCCQVDPTVLPARVNQHVAIIRPDSRLLDARFLRYYLISPQIQGLMLSWAGSGGTRNALTKGMIESLQVFAPVDIKEQQAIACILGALDDKIELNRRMNQTLEAMAQAIFKSWFVDFDPVRAKAAGQQPAGLAPHIAELFPDSFEESELGEIPEGWMIGTLGDVAENPRRGVRPEEIDPETPYIGLEHMPRRHIALSEWGLADTVESSKFRFYRGEILFGKLRPYFHKVGVAPLDGVCSTDILVISPRSTGWFGFVLGHVSSKDFVDYTDVTSTGTKMPRTSWGDMAQYKVVLPNEKLAEVFTTRIGIMIERIIVDIHESRNLAALRDTLLPKLISGELRISDAERIAGGYV